MREETELPFRVLGFVDAVCRDAATKKVAWEIHQSNMMLDWGRRALAKAGLSAGYVFTSPSTEVVRYDRSSLISLLPPQISAGTATVYDAFTMTKSWTVTFAAPASNTKIGTVGVMDTGVVSNIGAAQIIAMTVISPFKIQSPLQTLEITYRLTVVLP